MNTVNSQYGFTETEFAKPGPLSMQGPEGIRFDFNYGCRVQIPVSGWRVRMSDLDTFNVLLESVVEAHEIVTSKRKYFVRFHLEVFDGPRLVFSHQFDATNRKVVLPMPILALGDSLAWIPILDAFREQHQCDLHLALGTPLLPLFREGYPLLHFVTEDELAAETGIYATYYVGLITPFTERDHQPTDPRISGLPDIMAYSLGVPCKERKPNLVISNKARMIEERYVCIATQSTGQHKYWNNPAGWPVVIDYLKSMGYRVLCIDQYWRYGNATHTNTIPSEAEDFTGDYGLQARASLLAHADFFIGLSSGFSWLAWAVGIPVVMISGFSHPSNEFYTPYRVINFHACNSCLNDTSIEINPDEFAPCPRHSNSPRQFQCTASITPQFVMRVVDTLIRDHQLA
jgi:autotransporter strand-loop-strand O-heptosyltransferase